MIANAFAKAARRCHAPDVVERLFDFLHQRQDAKDQKRQTDCTQNTDIDVVHKFRQGGGQAPAPARQGARGYGAKNGSSVSAPPKLLMIEKAQRQHGCQRQQGRVNKTCRIKTVLAYAYIA